MEILFIWLGIATVTGIAANARGRSFFGWFCLGMLFSLLALITVLVMRPIEPPLPQSSSPDPARARPSGPATRGAPTVATYRGYDIGVMDGYYWVKGKGFRSELDAKRWIDEQETPLRSRSVARDTAGLRVQGSSMFDQLVVGTKSYQSAIAALPQQRGKFLVTLICQPDNPHDKNAVAIMHGGEVLGFLPRDDAADWREFLDEEGEDTAPVEAYARIARSDEHETLGLRLDIDWPPDLISSR